MAHDQELMSGDAVRQLRQFLDAVERDEDLAYLIMHDSVMSKAQALAWANALREAIDRPDEFRSRVDALNDAAEEEEGASDVLWGYLRVAEFWLRDHGPGHMREEARAKVGTLLAQHGWPDTPHDINVYETIFEPGDFNWAKQPLLEATLKEAGLYDNGVRGRAWPKLQTFREHDAASNWTWSHRVSDEGSSAPSIRVALLSDFGTGTYPARYIAREIAKRGCSQLFHLGDVYYWGSQIEYEERFAEPLEPVLCLNGDGYRGTELYNIAENHDLYSGGGPYLAFMDECRRRGRTRQCGSYFCIEYPHHRIVGIDVNWSRPRRLASETSQSQREWLKSVLRTDGKTNLLLSGSPPYGEDGETPLLGDVMELGVLDRVHFWFWGHEHYCALFDKKRGTFFGSCIGHGGYPGAQRAEVVVGDEDETAVLWFEGEARFPDWTGLRPEIINNGWCELELKPNGDITLLYVDWLGALRCRASYSRSTQVMVVQPMVRPQRAETYDDLCARGVLS